MNKNRGLWQYRRMQTPQAESLDMASGVCGRESNANSTSSGQTERKRERELSGRKEERELRRRLVLLCKLSRGPVNFE